MFASLPANPVVSFVISTHNRRDVLLQTLSRLQCCGLHHRAFQVLVVDNASRDGTAQAVCQMFPQVILICLQKNRGACARNEALRQAAGRYVVFLDDDSYPWPGSVQRMIEHFDADRRLGAAVFSVILPDGSGESSAYPDVCIGCGTGFRAAALQQVGGLPEDFFMQAEEYDLSLRLLAAGWKIRHFDDLRVTHLKTPAARRAWRTMRLDVRNNFMLATRYAPAGWMLPLTSDWIRRYWKLAARAGQRSAFVVGLLQGATRSLLPGHRRPLDTRTFEQFLRLDMIQRFFQNLLARSVLFVDYGKNILPYWLAARKCGKRIVAIADNRLAGRSYRNIPVVGDSQARSMDFDAAIITNSSPAHARLRRTQWISLDARPVLDPLQPITLQQSAVRSLAA